MQCAVGRRSLLGQPVQVSIGLAAGEPGSDFDSVMAAADDAMYTGKKQKKSIES